MNRLLMETEGKYSGYKHHPNYKEGDDIRKKPKSTPRSKALKGEKSKSWMDSGLTGTFDRKSAERRIKKTGSVL